MRWRWLMMCVLAIVCIVGWWTCRPPREVLLPPPSDAIPGTGVGLAVPVSVPPGQSLEIRNAGSAPVRIVVEWQGGRYVTRREVPPGWRLILHLCLPPGSVYVSPMVEAGRGGMVLGLRYTIRVGGG